MQCHLYDATYELLHTARNTKASCEGELEIEVRFGTIKGGQWHASVPPNMHAHVCSSLRSFSGWVSHYNSITEYLYYDHNIRLALSKTRRSAVVKNVLHSTVLQMKGSNMALKLCISEEVPYTSTMHLGPHRSFRAVSRSSFVYKNLFRYDLSHAVNMQLGKGYPEYQYELEIETLKTQERKIDHLVMSLEAKIRDIIQMCDLSRDSVFTPF